MRHAFGWSREILILQDEAALARSLAGLVLAEAERCVEARGRFALALSGGSTPRGAHRLLGQEALSSGFPWDRTHVFWADERMVEPADPASNYGTALEDFLRRVPIPRESVHPMPAGSPPIEGARAYERVLSRVLDPVPGSVPRLDLVLLGLGRDGHTASLFPGDPALEEQVRFVVPVRGGHPLVDRLTLTLPVLNHAARKVFAVSGRDKAEAVRAVLEEQDPGLPASRVEGDLTWIMDPGAASMLSSHGNPGIRQQEEIT